MLKLHQYWYEFATMLSVSYVPERFCACTVITKPLSVLTTLQPDTYLPGKWNFNIGRDQFYFYKKDINKPSLDWNKRIVCHQLHLKQIIS